MFHITVAIALAGLAAAQEPSIDAGPDGNLRVTRQLSTTLSGKP